MRSARSSRTRPGAGADVQEGADPLVAHLADEGRFDLLVRDVQRPDRVPVIGDALEVGGRRLGPVRPNRGQAFEIAAHGRRRLLAVDHQVQDCAEQLTAEAVTRRPVEHVRSLRLTVEQTGIGEHPEMATDTGLALAQYPAQLPHRQLALGQDVERAKAGGFSDGAERSEKILHCMTV